MTCTAWELAAQENRSEVGLEANQIYKHIQSLEYF